MSKENTNIFLEGNTLQLHGVYSMMQGWFSMKESINIIHNIKYQ